MATIPLLATALLLASIAVLGYALINRGRLAPRTRIVLLLVAGGLTIMSYVIGGARI